MQSIGRVGLGLVQPQQQVPRSKRKGKSILHKAFLDPAEGSEAQARLLIATTSELFAKQLVQGHF